MYMPCHPKRCRDACFSEVTLRAVSMEFPDMCPTVMVIHCLG